MSIFQAPRPQHFLNFLPLPHGHGSFRPTLGITLVKGVCGPQQDCSLQQVWRSSLNASLVAFFSISRTQESRSEQYQNTWSDAHGGLLVFVNANQNRNSGTSRITFTFASDICEANKSLKRLRDSEHRPAGTFQTFQGAVKTLQPKEYEKRKTAARPVRSLESTAAGLP